MPKEKLIIVSLNIMLLKKGVALNNREEFINDYDEKNIISEEATSLLIYKKESFRDYPKWLKMFHNKIWGRDDIFEKMSKNNSEGLSILISVEEEDQTYIFAVNLGSGRYSIKKEMVDKRFGIYTAQKLLQRSEAKIKYAQSRVLKQNPVNKNILFGKDVGADDFILGMEDNEVVRELSIAVDNPTDFSNMIGKFSSLNVKFLFKAGELPCLGGLAIKLKSLLEIYKSITDEEIRKLYKGLRPLYDDETRDLFVELESRLDRKTTDFFLFESEIDFEYSLIVGFKYRFNDGSESEIYPTLNINDYLSHKSSPKIDDLERDFIALIDEDGKDVKQWSIKECVYGEMAHNGRMFLLSYGEWFEIGKDKYARIENNIKAIEDATFNIPNNVKDKTLKEVNDYKKTPEYKSSNKTPKERIFNMNLCSELNGELFDEINKQITLYEDQIEVCDVYCPKQKEFIHSKINNGSSALSHLFNQGFVSAKSLAEYTEDFIKSIKEKIPNSSIAKPIEGYTVRYLIINDSSTNRLPFFSKMILDEKITTLRSQGFSVKLTWVNNVFKIK